MKMIEIREKAIGLGIKPRAMRKTDLIHAIQRIEGYTQCYGNLNGDCQQEDCCFRDDCIKTKN